MWVAAVLGLLAVASACGADSDPSAAAAGSDRNADVLAIKDFMFDPEPLVVPVGTVVRVVNEDDAPHTATADDDSFDTGELGQDESEEITLATPGELSYHCTIHDYMRGLIRVTG